VAFAGSQRLAMGRRLEVALAVRAAQGPVLAFDLETGAPVEFDLSGEEADIAARYADAPRGPGRPKLGVVAREVTLLPSHWEWLNAQRGGASAALRRLVDAACEVDEEAAAKVAAFRFLSAMVGDQPNFQDAARALFAGDLARLASLAAHWPGDVLGIVKARLEGCAKALSAPVSV